MLLLRGGFASDVGQQARVRSVCESSNTKSCIMIYLRNKTVLPVFYRRLKYRYEFGCVWIKALFIVLFFVVFVHLVTSVLCGNRCTDCIPNVLVPITTSLVTSTVMHWSTTTTWTHKEHENSLKQIEFTKLWYKTWRERNILKNFVKV